MCCIQNSLVHVNGTDTVFFSAKYCQLTSIFKIIWKMISASTKKPQLNFFPIE